MPRSTSIARSVASLLVIAHVAVAENFIVRPNTTLTLKATYSDSTFDGGRLYAVHDHGTKYYKDPCNLIEGERYDTFRDDGGSRPDGWLGFPTGDATLVIGQDGKTVVICKRARKETHGTVQSYFGVNEVYAIEESNEPYYQEIHNLFDDSVCFGRCLKGNSICVYEDWARESCDTPESGALGNGWYVLSFSEEEPGPNCDDDQSCIALTNNSSRKALGYFGGTFLPATLLSIMLGLLF